MPASVGRLPARVDFLRVAAARRKFAAPGLVLQLADTPDAAPSPRVGFTATKKIGNAVIRNRAKRRLRAVARQILPENAVSGRDYVLIARNETVSRPYALLVGDLQAALRRLGAWRND